MKKGGDNRKPPFTLTLWKFNFKKITAFTPPIKLTKKFTLDH